jgi:hypothetical protein
MLANQMERLRYDVSILRALIDSALESDADRTLMKASADVLYDRLERLHELEASGQLSEPDERARP